MARGVVWTPAARLDLADCVAYIAQESALEASRWGKRVLVAADSLSEFPNRHAPRFHCSGEGVRELIFESYRIWYVVFEEVVEVIALFHGSRDRAKLSQLIARERLPGD